MLLIVLAGLAGAAEGDTPAEGEETAEAEPRIATTGRAWGHVKTFALGSFFYDLPPYEIPIVGEVEILPEEPQGQAIVDARLNLKGTLGDHLSGEIAHAVTTTLGGQQGVSVVGTGVAPVTDQLVDLNWTAFQDEDSTVRILGRTDRLFAKGSWPGVDVVVGRQPVSFGTGLFFTPLDLVNPFTPATIDTEYKPGVDAVRVDLYRGVSGKGTLVATWAGPPVGSDEAAAESRGEALEWVNLAASGQGTVGVTDLGGFAGLIRGDVVAGATLASSIQAVSLHGDVAVTLPRADPDEKPFVRAVVGAGGVPWWRLNLNAELYLQTHGTTDPTELLTRLQGDRYTRGELWLGGVAYGGLAANLEVTPLVHVGAAGFVNLTDGSALVAPSLSWSVAQNAEIALGGYLGLGPRPEVLAFDPADPRRNPLQPRSEFGVYPGVVFLQGKSYF